MCATFAKTVTEADIVLFAAVSGDNNAIHINEEFAAGTIFKGRFAHGLLSASVISAAVRQQAARSGQQLRIAKPAIQGACPGRRYCPCDRHGQRDDPSEISRLTRHGLHG
jgi:3-hydroxybutyryl-CoA dehydratase